MVRAFISDLKQIKIFFMCKTVKWNKTVLYTSTNTRIYEKYFKKDISMQRVKDIEEMVFSDVKISILFEIRNS